MSRLNSFLFLTTLAVVMTLVAAIVVVSVVPMGDGGGKSSGAKSSTRQGAAVVETPTDVTVRVNGDGTADVHMNVLGRSYDIRMLHQSALETPEVAEAHPVGRHYLGPVSSVLLAASDADLPQDNTGDNATVAADVDADAAAAAAADADADADADAATTDSASYSSYNAYSYAETYSYAVANGEKRPGVAALNLNEQGDIVSGVLMADDRMLVLDLDEAGSLQATDYASLDNTDKLCDSLEVPDLSEEQQSSQDVGGEEEPQGEDDAAAAVAEQPPTPATAAGWYRWYYRRPVRQQVVTVPVAQAPAPAPKSLGGSLGYWTVAIYRDQRDMGNYALGDVLNSVNAVYTNQGRNAFLPTYRTGTISMSNSEIGAQLSEFSAYVDTLADKTAFDLHHLFSGAGQCSGTVGLAYTGVACYIHDFGTAGAKYATGITQKLCDFGTLVIITSHELGHNLGANHDTTGCSLMSTIACGSTTFNPTSLAEMTNGPC